MHGIIIGAAATLGACALLKHRRHCHRRGGCHMRGRHRHGWGHHHGHHTGFEGYEGQEDYHHGGGGRWGGHGGHGGRWGGRGWSRRGPARWVGKLADLVDATPEQEEVIHEAVSKLLTELRGLREEAGSSRRDLGSAFGEERLDEERLGELFARHDQLLEGARKAVVGALAKIHEVLEPAQRERLARWLGRRGPDFGPYRV